MREHGIRRAIGVATLLAASASMSPEAAAQLPPLSPTAGFCPATAPFLLWGMSAGGELNYEMALWKPERVVAFTVEPAGDQVNTRLTTSWLPNERIAKGWQAIAMGQPVTP